MKKAFVTGITGQDGAYLASFLLDKGYEVHGALRRNSSQNLWRINELGIAKHDHLFLHDFDLTDLSNIIHIVDKIEPDEIYNLAAQSFVGLSFDQPVTTCNITGMGVLNLLEAIRLVNPKIKFYQASTSEMFGKVQAIPQDESTSFYPRSPYGVAKLFAHWMTINYKESYDIFAASGILFNHESPLRGLEFVTRKITDSIAKIAQNKIDYFELGNLDAKRDWGYAKDYVEGMWKMLQVKHPDNFILATNQTHSVREFVQMAANAAGISIEFVGEGINEVGVDKKSGKTILKINKSYYRPAEVDLLIGNNNKAKDILQWEPKTNLQGLCELMVEADLRRNKEDRVF